MSVRKYIQKFLEESGKLFTKKKILAIVFGTALCSFGVYNIHQQADITEGGILGLILLLNHWTGISPSLLSPILDVAAYAVAFRFLGKDFLKLSIVSSLSLAGFFLIWEQFPPIVPSLAAYPLVAAVAGALCVGVGCGLIIRQGGSGSGDDALALTIAKITPLRISAAYLLTDITVLLLSLSYIPLKRLLFSFVTVIISSLLVEFVQKFGTNKEKNK